MRVVGTTRDKKNAKSLVFLGGFFDGETIGENYVGIARTKIRCIIPLSAFLD